MSELIQKKIRYGDLVSALSVRQRRISANDIAPKPQYDAAGQLLPHRPERLKLRKWDVFHLVWPYLKTRLFAQAQTVLPLVLYLFLFYWLMQRQGLPQPWWVLLGVAAVVFGLMLFIEGLERGLMPFAEDIGDALPRKLTLPKVLGIVGLLGVSVTLAEPAIGALKTAGSLVRFDTAPLLYVLLNHWSGALVAAIGIGVGLAAILATLRFIYGWRLKPLIYITLFPVLLLSLYMHAVPELRSVLGLAWDSGGITTGPVTVPLVLALGIGVAAAAGGRNTEASGFGIVTLASLLPILCVLLLGLYVAYLAPGGLSAHADAVAAVLPDTQGVAYTTPPWYELSPGRDIVMGLRAIVPLILFLFVIMHWILRQPVQRPQVIYYGLLMAVSGMIVFNLGLTYGLTELGGKAGEAVPHAFQHGEIAGYVITLLFAWLLGFGATLAEPALQAMGLTVETLTQGALRKKTLIYAVSVGVAFGITLGVLRLLLEIPLLSLLLPTYFIALILTGLANEEYVSIAWDSAGVTTGPVTVPLVLALGLGLGNSRAIPEGFGILALASVGPIISVLAVGLWVAWQVKRSHAAPSNARTLSPVQPVGVLS